MPRAKAGSYAPVTERPYDPARASSRAYGRNYDEDLLRTDGVRNTYQKDLRKHCEQYADAICDDPGGFKDWGMCDFMALRMGQKDSRPKYNDTTVKAMVDRRHYFTYYLPRVYGHILPWLQLGTPIPLRSQATPDMDLNINITE